MKISVIKIELVQEIIVSINCMNCKNFFSVLLQSGYLCADLKNSLHASLIPSRGKNLLLDIEDGKSSP